MRPFGKKVHITYPSGLEVEAEYVSPQKVRWTAIAGPPAGTSGENEMHSAEVATDVYFLNWIEDNGIAVSQVLDLEHEKVTTFVTFDTPDGRRSSFQEGRVQLLQ
jgi:MoaF N-terminal domain